MGAPSTFLIWMASQGALPGVTHVLVANTGSEVDRKLHDGSRIKSDEFVESFLRPMCDKAGLALAYVRTRLRDGITEMPSLWAETKRLVQIGKLQSIPIPLFGSNGGRRKQTCTDVFKIRAMDQYVRREGATSVRSYQGLHAAEMHRIDGDVVEEDGSLTIYRTIRRVKVKTYGLNLLGEKVVNSEKTVRRPIKWKTHCYPLIDMHLDRETVQRQCNQYKVPYLITSECDMCPHQDLERWKRHTPAVINEIAEIEAQMRGEFFFTDRRIPLKQALHEKESGQNWQGCESGLCFT
jgi:hypothetical protein